VTADARGAGPVWHEAFTLPLVLLSAALLGGLASTPPAARLRGADAVRAGARRCC
jgi:hypothetical protein